MTTVIKINGMHCKKCAARVESAIKKLGGKAKVSLEAGEATIESTNQIKNEDLKQAIEELGFTISE